MDKFNLRLLAGLVFALSLTQQICRGQQPNTIYNNQSPFQRQQQQSPFQRQQFQQQQQRQQQQGFPNTLNTLQPLGTGLGAITPITPLSGISQQNPYRIYNRLEQQNYVPITAYQNELNYDGSFSYGYATADGTTAQAQGYVKNLGLGEDVEAQVVQGSYSYTSPEGTPITVRYIADENGFRAEGAHIPTPPPIPDAIAKSLQYISSAQPYQQTLNPNLSPYQTPYRQFSGVQPLRPGQQQQLTPFQLQQQQARTYQQQLGGQLQPPFAQYPGAQQQQQGNAFFGGGIGGGLGGGLSGALGGGVQFSGQFGDLSGQNFTKQSQGLQQDQQQQALQQQQQKQNQQQQNQQQQQQQQQLATQELRARPNQLVNTYGYRRYKKAVVRKN